MQIGIIGLGKLGLACALAMESKGHDVVGYDINPKVADILKWKKLPYVEAGGNELLQKSNIKLLSLEETVEFADIIFIAVQTPHDQDYDGTIPVPEERMDFDYTYLINAFKGVITAITYFHKPKVVSIISTVLPGTIRREILPLFNAFAQVVYNPSFIALGTVGENFLHPEFILMGSDDKDALEKLSAFYSTITDAPRVKCTLEEAEMIKISYNVFIATKVCFANTVMELSHKVGNVNCDKVIDALALATDRVISTKFMRGGMTVAGPCHSRDLIAMSHISQKMGILSEFYDNLIQCRQDQTRWLAELIKEQHVKTGLPVVILGKAYKKNTDLTVGSATYLLTYYLRKVKHTHFDPMVDDGEVPVELFQKAVYFIATQHDLFKEYPFPKGSVVIDPFRYITPQKHFELIQIGNR